MVALILTADYGSIEHELDRIAGLPSPADLLALELQLSHAFADVTAHVHVITGALKASGKTTTDTDPAHHRWEGQMTWGGEAPGFFPKPPPAHPRREERPEEDQRAHLEVVYAFYEKRRGGEHDYLSHQAAYTAQFKRVFEDAVKGKLP